MCAWSLIAERAKASITSNDADGALRFTGVEWLPDLGASGNVQESNVLQ